MIFIILVLVLLIGFFVLSNRAKIGEKNNRIERVNDCSDNERDVNIVQISDVHYFSNKLTDYGHIFESEVENGDAKSVRYVESIMDAFVYEMYDKKPDLIVVSGDISYNGEKLSHIEFASKLRKLKESGIDSIVIPGNHDIDYYKVKSFFGEQSQDIDAATIEDFIEIYREFGYDSEKINSRDKHSLSYIYDLNEKISILMIDTSTENNIMNISDKTYKWIERELQSRSLLGKTVISVTHQNILGHNKMFISGYKIANSSKLVDLFNKYNVRLNLSGHMHAQHISENKKVYDAAVGCISLYPNLYAEIKIDGRRNILYSTVQLNIEKWAKESCIDNEDLINFNTYIMNYMSRGTYNRTINSFNELNISENDRKAMLEFFNKTNLAYFSGTMADYDDLNVENPAYVLWQKYYEKDLLGKYLASIYQEEKKNHNKLEIMI